MHIYIQCRRNFVQLLARSRYRLNRRKTALDRSDDGDYTNATMAKIPPPRYGAIDASDICVAAPVYSTGVDDRVAVAVEFCVPVGTASAPFTEIAGPVA